jgi:hypothetical protein
MTQPDDLIDSYRAAQKLQEKLQNSVGPSDLTRRQILAHAEQLANNKSNQDTVIPLENTTDLIAKEAINTPAANDSQWKIRALASVAVFGIAGLLMLQLSREAPDEFLPKATPPASAERSAESAAANVSENESKSAADKPVQATAPIPAAAPAPAPAAQTQAPAPVAATPKPAPSVVPSSAAKSVPQPEQIAKKSEITSRSDLETAVTKEPSEPRAEARADKAAELAQSIAPPPSAAAAAPTPAPVRSAAPASPAPAPASAPAAMTDSAKLSRSAPAAPRARANETTNANTKLFAAIQTKDAAALKLALDSGDDKNAKNAAGTPVLSVCVQSEQLNLVQLLIAAGADVNALDARGVSPLGHARNRGLTEIVALLLNSGAK